jgi:outer membrane lipoprotein-sorting protein
MGVTLMPEQIFSRLTNLTVPENQAAGDSLIIQGTIKPDTADTVEQSSQNPMQNADFQMRLTVDTKRWVISEIKTVRDTSVISSADILYEEYEQGILLPQKVVIHFHVPNSMREREQTGDTPGAMNENSPVDDIENLETIQGRITIDFGRYRVNTGLSDDFFQEQDG